MHIAQKFEALLEMYPRPDGRRWSGQEIDEATGGVVSRSYVTNLRKGRIENPGYEKMRAIAKAMGFAPEVWFDEGLGEGRSIGQAEEFSGVAGRLEHLFEVIRNPKTGEPYTKTLSENRQIEQNVGTRQLNQCQPVFGLLRPASAQAASLDEPRDRPLHYPSPRRVNPL
jgi:transcriptional regulator with XRE-family HTH domain